MPTPARTSTDDIVAAGWAIVEREGVDALTMQSVARAVGVRAPSLYKRVSGRGDLIRRIATRAALELGDRLQSVEGGDPREALRAMARVHRAFARDHPRAYGLLFSDVPVAWRIDDELNREISAPILHVAAALAGPGNELNAARMAVAWSHGFASMELAGAFRLGGDVESAFAYGIDRLIAAIESR